MSTPGPTFITRPSSRDSVAASMAGTPRGRPGTAPPGNKLSFSSPSAVSWPSEMAPAERMRLMSSRRVKATEQMWGAQVKCLAMQLP